MPLPTLDKTWIFKTGQIYITSDDRNTDNRNLWYLLKEILTDPTGWHDSAGAPAVNSYPWVVVASSDSVTADWSDLWTDPSKLIWNNAGAAHSWTILRQPAINPMYELTWQCGRNTNTYTFTTRVSPSMGNDLSVLSTLNPPVGPADNITTTITSNFTGFTTPFSFSLGCMMSTDGECTRVFVHISGITNIFFLFDRPKNPVPGWTTPSITYMYPSGNSDPLSYGNINDNARIYSYVNGRIMGLYASTEFYIDAAIGQRAETWNQITEEWPMTPMGLVSATPGVRGRHGEIYDLWFTSNILFPGMSLPETGPRQFMCFGEAFVPWDQSDLVTNL